MIIALLTLLSLCFLAAAVQSRQQCGGRDCSPRVNIYLDRFSKQKTTRREQRVLDGTLPRRRCCYVTKVYRKISSARELVTWMILYRHTQTLEHAAASAASQWDAVRDDRELLKDRGRDRREWWANNCWRCSFPIDSCKQTMRWKWATLRKWRDLFYFSSVSLII